jgi:hypothetical protein
METRQNNKKMTMAYVLHYCSTECFFLKIMIFVKITQPRKTKLCQDRLKKGGMMP